MSLAARRAAALARREAQRAALTVVEAPDGATIVGPYRYRLWRTIDAEGRGGTMAWVMLNPSTADAVVPDPTITRCVGFATDLGYGRIEVVNLFAARATDPRDLDGFEDPIGPVNDATILAAVQNAARVVVAWGAHPGTEVDRRSAEVLALLQHAGVSVWCFGVTASGRPAHPLYLAKSTLMQPYPPAPVVEPSTDTADLVESFRVVHPADPPTEVEIAARPLPAEPDPDRPESGWWDIPLRGSHVAVIDTETTGKDPATAHIVEVSVVVIQGLDLVQPAVAYTTRVRPPVPIPPDATAIHGISDADVADAPTWAEVLPELARVLAGRVACAFNVPYDQQVIAAETTRVGLPLPYGAVWGRWLDVLVLAKGLDQFEKGRKLTDVAGRRGILAAAAAHGAAADAMATAMLLARMLQEAAAGKSLGRGRVFSMPRGMSLSKYLQWQRERALAQEVDFAEYQQRSGRRDPVDMPWHVLEGVTPPAAVAPPEARTTECKSCRASILWLVTTGGKSIPLDPPVLRAMPVAEVAARREADRNWTHPGKRVALTTEAGTVAWGHLDEEGSIVGRESHWGSCPTANQHR